MTQLERRAMFIDALAEFLAADPFYKSVMLEVETLHRSPDDPRPRVMRQWAKLGGVVGVRAGTGVEETKILIAELLADPQTAAKVQE